MRGIAMSTSAIIAIVVVALVVAAIAVFLTMRSLRTRRLRTRFGPEYRRALEETGSKTQAEAKLEKLERRVDRFDLRPLTPVVRANFVAAWQKIQARFVDDPKIAVTEADKLIQEIMAARGYPVTDFEQRAADISVNHPLIVEHYRAGHDIAREHSKGRASTEDLRRAMIHYRTLFAELADEPELIRSKTAQAGRA
jgi:hypothetical protein